jgi:putative SOS response-associated peptidase YedK
MLPSMCSRYSLISPPEAVRAFFGMESVHAFPPRYNIAPTEPVAIVRTTPKGGRELALVRWGLIPSWSKDPARFGTLFNARAETAAEKPSFRGALRHRRCVVPADGFYEWLGEKGKRRPHLVRRKDRALMALAGLWEHWLGADGSEIETMAILTVPSNVALSWLHARMPVILEPAQHDAWLDCRSGSAVDIEEMLASAADDLLDAVEVGPAVNNPKSDGPELHVPVDRPAS